MADFGGTVIVPTLKGIDPSSCQRTVVMAKKEEEPPQIEISSLYSAVATVVKRLRVAFGQIEAVLE